MLCVELIMLMLVVNCCCCRRGWPSRPPVVVGRCHHHHLVQLPLVPLAFTRSFCWLLVRSTCSFSRLSHQSLGQHHQSPRQTTRAADPQTVPPVPETKQPDSKTEPQEPASKLLLTFLQRLLDEKTCSFAIATINRGESFVIRTILVMGTITHVPSVLT